MASRFIDELPEKHVEKNSFFDDDQNNIGDFEFNQDFELMKLEAQDGLDIRKELNKC